MLFAIKTSNYCRVSVLSCSIIIHKTSHHTSVVEAWTWWYKQWLIWWLKVPLVNSKMRVNNGILCPVVIKTFGQFSRTFASQVVLRGNQSVFFMLMVQKNRTTATKVIKLPLHMPTATKALKNRCSWGAKCLTVRPLQFPLFNHQYSCEDYKYLVNSKTWVDTGILCRV